MVKITSAALVILAGASLAASLPAAGPNARLGPPANAQPEPAHQAQESSSSGISVTGEGRATLAAERAEVMISVKSKAKTPGDALAGFKAKKALFEKAVAAFEGVETRPGGVEVGLEKSSNQSFVFNGQAPVAPEFEVVEVMTLVIPASDQQFKTVVELIDESKDVDCDLAGVSSDPMQAIYMAQAGGARSQPAAIRYLPSEEGLTEARRAAMALAFQDAKAQAEALATIAGVRVGAVLSLRVLQSFDGASTETGAHEGTVRLSVRFGIE